MGNQRGRPRLEFLEAMALGAGCDEIEMLRRTGNRTNRRTDMALLEVKDSHHYSGRSFDFKMSKQLSKPSVKQ